MHKAKEILASPNSIWRGVKMADTKDLLQTPLILAFLKKKISQFHLRKKFINEFGDLHLIFYC